MNSFHDTAGKLPEDPFRKSLREAPQPKPFDPKSVAPTLSTMSEALNRVLSHEKAEK
jgi:hypothetical protein